MDLEKILSDFTLLIESYKALENENKLYKEKIQELETLKPIQLMQRYENIIQEKQNLIHVLEKRISFLKKKNINEPKKQESNENMTMTAMGSYHKVLDELKTVIIDKRKSIDNYDSCNSPSKKIKSNKLHVHQNLNENKKDFQQSDILLNNNQEKQVDSKSQTLEHKKEKKKSTKLIEKSQESNHYFGGQKINLNEYKIINLKAVSGKILEYYMNLNDNIVYKKIANGFIGPKLGHISDFNNLQN